MRNFVVFAVWSIFLVNVEGIVVKGNGREESFVRPSRSISNIARLILGGNDIPPDHPLVIYPSKTSSQTQATSNSQVSNTVVQPTTQTTNQLPSNNNGFQQQQQQQMFPNNNGFQQTPSNNNNEYQHPVQNSVGVNQQQQYNNPVTNYVQPQQQLQPQQQQQQFPINYNTNNYNNIPVVNSYPNNIPVQNQDSQFQGNFVGTPMWENQQQQPYQQQSYQGNQFSAYNPQQQLHQPSTINYVQAQPTFVPSTQPVNFVPTNSILPAQTPYNNFGTNEYQIQNQNNFGVQRYGYQAPLNNYIPQPTTITPQYNYNNEANLYQQQQPMNNYVTPTYQNQYNNFPQVLDSQSTYNNGYYSNNNYQANNDYNQWGHNPASVDLNGQASSSSVAVQIPTKKETFVTSDYGEDQSDGVVSLVASFIKRLIQPNSEIWGIDNAFGNYIPEGGRRSFNA